MMQTNVDKELPLKYKPFRKIPPGGNGKHIELRMGEHSASFASLKQQKEDIIRKNTKKANEEFMKNKHQRPT